MYRLQHVRISSAGTRLALLHAERDVWRGVSPGLASREVRKNKKSVFGVGRRGGSCWHGMRDRSWQKGLRRSAARSRDRTRRALARRSPLPALLRVRTRYYLPANPIG